jgi:sugar lactone lactonase YvrE
VPHPSGLPLGANGLAFGSHGDLLVANTTEGTIVRIPVKPGGRAGTAHLFAGPDCRLWGADGIAMGSHGTLYVAANASEDVVRISPAGALAVIAARAAGDPLSSPSSIAFGPGWHDRAQVFISNSALFRNGAGAGVARADIAEWPLP